MKRFLGRLLRVVLVFAAGAATGYYARDRQQGDELRDAVERARREMLDVGLGAIERARQAGAGLTAGAEAAAESTRAAFGKLLGNDDAR